MYQNGIYQNRSWERERFSTFIVIHQYKFCFTPIGLVGRFLSWPESKKFQYDDISLKTQRSIDIRQHVYVLGFIDYYQFHHFVQQVLD